MKGKNSMKNELIRQYRERAKAMRKAGYKITLQPHIDFVCIEDENDPNAAWIFQGDSAHELLASVPEWIDANTYLLASATEW